MSKWAGDWWTLMGWGLRLWTWMRDGGLQVGGPGTVRGGGGGWSVGGGSIGQGETLPGLLLTFSPSCLLAWEDLMGDASADPE